MLWISLIFIAWSFPTVSFSEQLNPKIWEPLGYSSYYNKKIITTSSHTMLVWVYEIITNDNRQKTIAEVKKYDLEKSIKYQQYHHEVVLWEIDCKNRLWRLKDIIDFDREEKVLNRYRFNNSEWDSFRPKSRGELLYQKLCGSPQKPLK